MIYADYDYYLNEYSGTAVTVEEYLRLARRASALLDQMTCGRITADMPEAQMDKVRDACCALTEEYRAQESGGEVASAANDGYSETYVTSGRTPAQRLREIAELYLSNTGLLCSWVV